MTLTPLSGDADLCVPRRTRGPAARVRTRLPTLRAPALLPACRAVDSPDGLQYASKHGGGNDQVFISRDYVYSAAGEYVITGEGLVPAPRARVHPFPR